MHLRLRDAKHHGRNIPLQAKAGASKTLFKAWADTLKDKVVFTPAGPATNNKEIVSVDFAYAHETLFLYFKEMMSVIEGEL